MAEVTGSKHLSSLRVLFGVPSDPSAFRKTTTFYCILCVDIYYVKRLGLEISQSTYSSFTDAHSRINRGTPSGTFQCFCFRLRLDYSDLRTKF
jgi:hypothetical protein